MPYKKRQRFSPEMAAEESDLFDSLPDDLVISILSKLSSSAGCPSDFVKILMTCKKLNSLALHPLVLSKGSSKMFTIKAKNWSESARRFLKLCVDAGNAEAYYALLFQDLFVTSDENLEVKRIQTGGLEAVTAVNSSSFVAIGTPFERAEELKSKREEELNEAYWGKRPATAYITPSHPPIGGFMAEARQNYHQSAAALANQGPTFLTNEGTQIETREAAHDKEASTSSWAPLQVELRKFI
ncbi:hypothetical protein SLA2020_067850 [Shorea laevis]